MDKAAPAAPRRRRALFLTAFAALLLLLLGSLAGALYWAAGSPRGSAWVLQQLSQAGIGVEVLDPQGVLLGDLQARQLIISTGGVRIVVDQPSWRGLEASRSGVAGAWVRLRAAAVSAQRVTVSVTEQPDAPPGTWPTHLRLPLQLDIGELQAAEVLLPGMEGHPLRGLRTRLQLGGDQGRMHRLDGLSVQLDPLQISGQARIATDAPMPLEVDLQAVQATAGRAAVPPSWQQALSPDWQARLQLRGPLERFEAQASVRAKGQRLDARAQVAPRQPWPLPELDASTEGLDLSALWDALPATALGGTLRIAPASASTPHTLDAHASLTNARPGRWDMRQLPLHSVTLDARGRTDRLDALDLTQFEVQLSDGRTPAGTLQGRAHRHGDEFAVQAQFAQVQPALVDGRLPAMLLSGPLSLQVQNPAALDDGRVPAFKATADLNGRLAEPARSVQVKLNASGNEQRIELQQLLAAAGGAQAALSGTAERSTSTWQVKGKASLKEFDPRPWFPSGPGAGWPSGAYRLNLEGTVQAALPDSLRKRGPEDKRPLAERLAGVRVDASAQLGNSQLAGVPVAGDIRLQHAAAADPLRVDTSLDLGGNRIRLEGQLMPTAGAGSQDTWNLEARAPALARLAPLLRMALPPAQASELTSNLAGALNADLRAQGRWPAMSTQGKASATGVHAGPWNLGQGELRWQLGSTAEAPLEVQAEIGQAAWAGRQMGTTTVQIKGTAAAHDFSLHTELKAAPPAWMENLQGRTPAPAAPASDNRPHRTLIEAAAHGSLSGDLLAPPSERRAAGVPWAWKGTLQRFEMRTTQPGATPLLVTRDIGLELNSGPPLRAAITAGRAEVLGAGLRWERIDWQAGRGIQAQQLDMQAELDPIAVAPLLQRAQPNFGWGGDLVIGGKVVIRQTDNFSADIVLERVRGDLTVTEESGTQALGLTDLRVGLNAQNGVWNFTAGLAGHQLGVLGGALVVRTSPQLAWPAADAPVQGVLEAQVANLGTWGAWVPAGWRLDGKLNISASLGGRFNAPEYTGAMKGSGIGVRNMVEGIHLHDGEVDISLQGDTARINKFVAHGGAGTVRLEGDAKLDEGWRTHLKLVADKFQVLGRVDLRVVTSGEAQVNIDAESIKADGRFTVDEGLVDFTRLSSPSLGDDVVVTGRSNAPDVPPGPGGPSGIPLSLNLLVNLGHNLRMRGYGIDTRLSGELRVARPGGKWELQGTVNAVDGTFANYGQNLTIDRGLIRFSGEPSNMRLDIEATRPNLDVRVGVLVTGPLQNLRVRLFSEPDMSNNEKLSWLLLGRASDGLGRSDAALLQRAAFALLAGDGNGGPGALTKAVGIDDVSLRQTEGDTRETLVSVGKQVSKRIYVAYEQNLNTSTGSFQVIYRIAQRFVMRLQSGLDRSIDLIGTWRWE